MIVNRPNKLFKNVESCHWTIYELFKIRNSILQSISEYQGDEKDKKPDFANVYAKIGCHGEDW